MFKKLEKEVIRDEEKVLTTLHGFKIRKKLIFSVLLSMFVFIIGIQKIQSLRDSGGSMPPLVVLLTLVVCSFFLGATVIRKDPEKYLKQLGIVYTSIFVISFIVLLGYSIFDILFISIITATVALSIYDIF